MKNGARKPRGVSTSVEINGPPHGPLSVNSQKVGASWKRIGRKHNLLAYYLGALLCSRPVIGHIYFGGKGYLSQGNIFVSQLRLPFRKRHSQAAK